MKKRALIGFLTTQMTMLSNGITALASSEEYGLTDLMRDQSSKTADTQAMQIGTSFISDVFGYIITIGVYGLIAGQFIMTACDLLFITTPFIRKLLVSEKVVGQGKLGSNPHLLGHYQGWDDLRDRRLAEAQMYAQQGNMSMAENKLRWAQSAQNESYKSDARRAAINEGILSRNNGNNQGYSVRFDWSNRCFISNDLKALCRTGNAVSLSTYFKKRVFSIILVVVFIMMVIASNIFIDTGMNVGKAILKVLGLV